MSTKKPAPKPAPKKPYGKIDIPGPKERPIKNPLKKIYGF